MRDTDAPVKVNIIVARSARRLRPHAAQIRHHGGEVLDHRLEVLHALDERGDERVVDVGSLLEDDAGLVDRDPGGGRGGPRERRPLGRDPARREHGGKRDRVLHRDEAAK
jgi:hypothetical protein